MSIKGTAPTLDMQAHVERQTPHSDLDDKGTRRRPKSPRIAVSNLFTGVPSGSLTMVWLWSYGWLPGPSTPYYPVRVPPHHNL